MKLRNLITQEIRQAIHDELADDRVKGLEGIADYLSISKSTLSRMMQKYKMSNPLPLIHQRIGPWKPRRNLAWTTKAIAFSWWLQIRVAEEARKASFKRAKKAKQEKEVDK